MQDDEARTESEMKERKLERFWVARDQTIHVEGRPFISKGCWIYGTRENAALAGLEN